MAENALEAQQPHSLVMSYADLYRDVTAFKTSERPSYQHKMLHDVRGKDVVDRIPFICDLVASKTILDVGASGQLHVALKEVCKKVYGLDLHPEDADTDKIDFDDPSQPIPVREGVEAVVACEIFEHLSNPGFLLSRLRKSYPSQPLVVSAPSAFSAAAAQHIKKGYENVNKDHVAWYSPKTLEWLLARHGYKVKDWAWYNGQPYTAEGIVAVAE